MKSSHRIQLVLADVDGTLVTPDKALTERTCSVVQKLAESDIAFAITSGRPPRGMSMVVETLDLRTPFSAFNGGMLMNRDMTPIEVKEIPQELVAPVVQGLIAHGLDAWIFRRNDWLVRDPAAPHVAREQSNIGFAPTVTADLDRHDQGVIKIVGVSDDRATMKECVEAMRERASGRRSAALSRPHYMDITHPEANKGQVVRALSRELGIPHEAIATIGDMPNDIMMFAESGLSVAMGQSSEEVKRAARRVTKPNTEEGFAEAIERFVLSDA
jgi:Cof subfamily protein (haloacid dehalogenase superfamily)